MDKVPVPTGHVGKIVYGNAFVNTDSQVQRVVFTGAYPHHPLSTDCQDGHCSRVIKNLCSPVNTARQGVNAPC